MCWSVVADFTYCSIGMSEETCNGPQNMQFKLKLQPCTRYPYHNGRPIILFIMSKWVKVFRIIPEFRILRLTFHRKSASKC